MKSDGLRIVHRGAGFVVVDKPAGISVEAYADHDTVEARAWVQFQRAGSPKRPFVGIVHRLDRPVSGLLVLARNKSTLRRLNQSFAEKLVQKKYVARTQVAVEGPRAGLLEDWLARGDRGKKAIVTTPKARGAKLSTLRYELLSEGPEGYTYIITPITGRYHQIRVQLAHAGAPIVGDERYGSSVSFRPNQITLHATALTLPDSEGHPLTLRSAPDW